MKFSFTANATSKEDAKTQIRSEPNRDAPDWAVERVMREIDAAHLTPGHRIKVSMSGESEDKESLEVSVDTSAE